MSDSIFSLPSVNPADLNSLEGCLDFLKQQVFIEMEKVLPCKVISYDRNKNRAILQPAIYDVGTEGQKLQKAPLYDIPVFCMGGGGIFLSFPLNEGDSGWIISSDKDISIFKQNLEVSSPNTYLRHRYDQAFFIPDKINNINIDDEDNNAFVLSTNDKETKISLESGRLELKSSININFNASNVNIASSNVNVNSSNINLGGDGGQGVARIGDKVQVNITSGSSAGTWEGTITSGSSITKSV